MKKVALLLPGHLRSYKDCIQSLSDNILKKYDTDVFINTWDKEHNTSSFKRSQSQLIKEDIVDTYKFYGAKNVFFNIENYSDNELELNENLRDKLMNPKWYSTKYYVPASSKQFICQSYKIYTCNKMKKEIENKYNFKYDLVIRSRPDIIVNDLINYNNNNLTLLKSNNYDMLHYEDHFYFGSSESMDRYVNMYEDLEEIFDLYNELILNVHWIPRIYCIIKNIPYSEIYVGPIKLVR